MVPRITLPRTTRTQDNSHLGQVTHKMTSTQDNSYHRQLIPKLSRILEKCSFSSISIFRLRRCLWPMLWRLVSKTTYISCFGCELPWARIVKGTNCPEYELSWVRVFLGMVCPEYNFVWVRVIWGTSCLVYMSCQYPSLIDRKLWSLSIHIQM